MYVIFEFNLYVHTSLQFLASSSKREQKIENWNMAIIVPFPSNQIVGAKLYIFVVSELLVVYIRDDVRILINRATIQNMTNYCILLYLYRNHTLLRKKKTGRTPCLAPSGRLDQHLKSPLLY